MTALPPESDFTGASVKQGGFKIAINALRAYLVGLLGADGTKPTALQTLGVPGCKVLAKSGAYTVTTSDRGALITCSGTWTLGLPAAATAGESFVVYLRNDGSGLITIDPSGSETINGVTTLTLPPGQGGAVICTGSAWLVAGWLGGAPFLFPNGAAGAPSLAFAGDPNTGFYSVGADQIGMATGGTLRATLSTSAFTLNLPLAGTSVQSGATDDTAGRLLKAGASATVLSASPALRMTVGGTANAITLTSGAGISGTPPTGLRLRFRATSANTGATTIALDGGSAIACRTITGVALPSGYIRTGTDTEAIYDGTNWVLNRELEIGSNASGEFVRDARGRQVCTRRLTGIGPISTATGSLFASAEQFEQSWAATFAALHATKILSYDGASGAAASWPLYKQLGTTTQTPRFWLLRTTSSAATDFAVAIEGSGTWY